MALILIVDDSPSVIEQFTAILTSQGHEILVATNGADAVELAKQNSPHVILMDVVMPGKVNGFQATREIADNVATKDIPIIIATNKDSASDREWGKRQGARVYLTKPVRSSELIDAVNQVLDK